MVQTSLVMDSSRVNFDRRFRRRSLGKGASADLNTAMLGASALADEGEVLTEGSVDAPSERGVGRFEHGDARRIFPRLMRGTVVLLVGRVSSVDCWVAVNPVWTGRRFEHGDAWRIFPRLMRGTVVLVVLTSALA